MVSGVCGSAPETLLKIGRLVVALGAFAAAGTAAPQQDTGQSCSLTTPELEKALDAVHAARDGSISDSERVVKEWLPKTTQTLASDQKVSREWLHLAVDLGRELKRLGRTEDARKLFARVAEVDAQGDWGRKAAAHVKALPRHP